MNRLPLWLSIVAVVIAVAALSLALLLPGPQGPKGDTGPQGIQGIQGPPSSLSVQRQVASFNVTSEIGPFPTISMSEEGCSIDLNAGDVLQGYVSCARGDVVYQVTLFLPSAPAHHGDWLLSSGQGGAAFCYVAEATGTYILNVGAADELYISDHYRLPYSEDVPVVYWISSSSERQ
jgi:hypothetical protein